MSRTHPAPWDSFLSQEDRAVFAASGHGRRVGLGRRPAVIVVDVNHNFCGDRPEPILESLRRWRASSGERAWAAAGEIAKLLDLARERAWPVIYTTGAADVQLTGRWTDKSARFHEDVEHRTVDGNELLPLVAPRVDDDAVVLRKQKPSAFFGTELAPYLIDRQADCAIVCGGTTSGCVRATVVDAFSFNLRVAVLEEGTFDRCQASHAINLLDMDMKYADVVDLDEIRRQVGDRDPEPEREDRHV